MRRSGGLWQSCPLGTWRYIPLTFITSLFFSFTVLNPRGSLSPYPHSTPSAPVCLLEKDSSLWSYRMERIRGVRKRGFCTAKRLGRGHILLFRADYLLWCGPGFILKEKALGYQRMGKGARVWGDLHLLKNGFMVLATPFSRQFRMTSVFMWHFCSWCNMADISIPRQPRSLKTLAWSFRQREWKSLSWGTGVTGALPPEKRAVPSTPYQPWQVSAAPQRGWPLFP